MPRTLPAAIAATILTALPALASDKTDVLDNYADIAQAAYGDSLAGARRLQKAVERLIAEPSAGTLHAARQAWREARVPYMQTEAFRFGNAIVDDWEGKVNAWPLDEGLIDYVDASYGGPTDENQYAALNVIANPHFTLSGEDVDATEITADLLENTLQEAGDIEANVATGYHAVEFLLWGQDLNGTGPGAGDRPWTDYVQGDGCTHGNCDRRAAYLETATGLLVSDLDWMTGQWGDEGRARTALTDDPEAGIAAMLTGMGSLSYGELAGQRMKLGMLLNDPEEEHDCFSDNTYDSHFYDAVGIRNVYTGHYTRIDGGVISGPALSDLVAEAAPEVDAALRDDLNASVAAMLDIKIAGEAGMAYDQLLARDNPAGEALITSAINRLVIQTRGIERAVAALKLDGIAIEGSDSLEDESAVFQ